VQHRSSTIVVYLEEEHIVNSQQAGGSATACVEHGIWTPVPTPPPRAIYAFTLHYKDIDAAEHDRIVQTGRMTFHMVGCSGDSSDHQPQQAVANGMAVPSPTLS
jgi:hypothetical protein